MATPQGVIQSFIRELMDYTTDYPTIVERLDNAVQKCSNGKYDTWFAAVEAFANDIGKYKDSSQREQRKFLAEKCGIIMDNDDTGALIGADASGESVKTAESIVDEDGNTSTGTYPSGNTNIHGVVFHWPDVNSLKPRQRNILSRMNNIWLEKAMELVEASYGVSFEDLYSEDILVMLDESNNNNGIVWTEKYTWKENNINYSGLALKINKNYFDTFNCDENGFSLLFPSEYMDRILAHEMTRVFMKKAVGTVPEFIMEGIADLTHGIDDIRYKSIYDVFNKSSNTLHNWSLSGNPSREVGYMFFRYLMKQSATEGVPDVSDFLPHNFVYKNDKTILKVMSGSNDYEDIDLSEFAPTVDTLDLSEDTAIRACIYGTNRRETIYLSGSGSVCSKGGNDVIYCNQNASHPISNSFYFGSNDGENTIYNFDGENGLIFVDNDSVAYWYSGNDRILRFGNTKVTLKNNANTVLQCWDTTGNVQYLNLNERSSNDYGNCMSYNANDSTIYVTKGFQGTLDLNESPYSNGGIYNVDASQVTDDFVVQGNDENNIIKLGLGHNTARYGEGSGRDVVYNFNPDNSEIEITNGELQKVGTFENDVYLRYSSGGDVLQLVGLVNKSFNLNGQRTMVMAQDKANTVNYADNTVYYGSKTKQDTLKVLNGERIHLYDSRFHDVDVLNGQSSEKRVALAGSNGTSTLYGSAYDDDLAGSGGNTTFYGGGSADRIWCGSGVDTIMFSVGSGRDVVNGFDTSKDKIQSINASLQKVGTADGDVYLRYSAGDDVLQIKGIVNKSFLLNGRRTMVMAQDKANTVNYAENTVYYGSKSQLDTLKVTNGERVHLYDSNIHDVDVLDGRQSAKAVKLGGGSGSGTLYGSNRDDDLAGTSTGTTYIRGGKGNDRIWAGNGTEIVYFGTGDGQDTVYSGGSKDKLVFYDISDISKLQVSKCDRNITFGIRGTNDKIIIDNWNKNSLCSIQLSNGEQYQLRENLSLSKMKISYMKQVQDLGDLGQAKVMAVPSSLADLVTEINPLTAVSHRNKEQFKL